ncbi:flavodoxin FldB [uncultured Paraglaciecola sp.]|jgi:flavodoxin II|uniref:flavodoxin FldB n=1 Tax=uncultured Paraglaciecola sp. TaxID=1765024 RepID=UPI0025D24292|nr:flavodoxin FldB [uncultured Paraglaciecola sp.]
MINNELKIGLFYGSTTCYTEMAAEKIQAKIDQLMGYPCIELLNIKDVSLTQAEDFEILIFGISTWDFGELQEDWESKWQDISGLNLANKTVAIFGLGDQLGYAEWFQDAVGMLHDELLVLDCNFVGYWPNDGYDFIASKALTEDKSFFVGLCLDDENQYDLTDERIDNWCNQLIAEIETL